MSLKNILETQVEEILLEFGFIKCIPDNRDERNVINYANTNLSCYSKYPSFNFYGEKHKSDFRLSANLFGIDMIIECRSQKVHGSNDEKLIGAHDILKFSSAKQKLIIINDKFKGRISYVNFVSDNKGQICTISAFKEWLSKKIKLK